MNQILQESLQTLRNYGIQPKITQNRHIKLQWENSQGHRVTHIVPVSPSDWRAARNNKAQLRRTLGRQA
jgi:hypothetical protein